jgi:hypothetical protein
MQIRTVEIEFTEDVFDADGNVRVDSGDHMYVDKRSAHSLVDVKGVARRVADGPTLGMNKRVPKRKPKPAPANEADTATAEEVAPDDSADEDVASD